MINMEPRKLWTPALKSSPIWFSLIAKRLFQKYSVHKEKQKKFIKKNNQPTNNSTILTQDYQQKGSWQTGENLARNYRPEPEAISMLDKSKNKKTEQNFLASRESVMRTEKTGSYVQKGSRHLPRGMFPWDGERTH